MKCLEVGIKRLELSEKRWEVLGRLEVERECCEVGPKRFEVQGKRFEAEAECFEVRGIRCEVVKTFRGSREML